ncbi:MAG: ATP-binding protein, partial [Anaerolineae bacterium]|nr:ATP-binding protein [Anaerolineae bacterium]
DRPQPWRGPVHADPGQMEQVLLNLLVNALDAMPQGGRLTVRTANVAVGEEEARRLAAVPPGDYVALSVSDTGVGMSGEIRAHLFEPFFTTKQPGKGSGLGLATVYCIVRQHRGAIWVETEPGLGSTFTVYLPRMIDATSSPDEGNG